MDNVAQAKKPGSKVGAPEGTGKLVGKDYITIAVFGLLMFLVFMAFSMILGMNANLFWFTHACGSLVAGIVWMYVAAKVPKRGAFAIMALIVAVVSLLLGMMWTGPVGIVVGGIAAELIAGAGDKRTAMRSMVAFAAFTLCFWIGQESMVIIAGQSYVDMVVEMGMSAEYGQALVDFFGSPFFFVAAVATAICPLIGGWIGSKLFKKHFARIAA